MQIASMRLKIPWQTRTDRLVGWVHRVRASGSLFDAAVGLAIAAVTWPVAKIAPSIGIDPSWIVGLHIAARDGMPFGADLLFTHGPLGFLGYPEPYLAWTSAAALAFVGTLHVVACATFFHLARQRLGGLRAFVLVLGAAFTFPWIAGWPMYGLLVFVAGVAALLRREARPSGDALAVGLGVAVGFAGLGKLNVAFVSLAVAVVVVVATAHDRPRSIAAFAAAAIATFVVLWVVTGQRLEDVPVYGRAALEFSVGYSESMGQLDPQTGWVSGVAALTTAMLAGLVWQRSASLRRRDGLVLWILYAAFVFASFKAGFTRAGVGMTIYLVTLLALWPVVIPRKGAWPTASLFVAGSLAAVLAVTAMPIGSLVDPVGRARTAVDQVSTVLWGRTAAASATAAALRAQYGLSSDAISLIAGRSVDVQPWEVAVAYAYPEIRWQPAPVFQWYSAYTPYLDQQNAAALRGVDAPERILWLTAPASGLSIDGRGVWFDSPTAKIEMLCRYLPLAATPDWQVLGRVADRCAPPVPVGSVTTTAGSPVRIPSNLAPGLLTIRVSGVARDLSSRLLTLAYKAPPWSVSDGSTAFRVPPGTMDEAAVLAVVGDAGYRGALALGPPPDALTIGPDPGSPGDGSPLTVVFEEIPLSSSSSDSR